MKKLNFLGGGIGIPIGYLVYQSRQLWSICFLLWRQVLIISDLLLTVLDGSAFKICIFSDIHRQHFPISGVKDLERLRSEKDTLGFLPSFFSCQTYELRVVDWEYFRVLKDFLWFEYLSLKVVAVRPMYCLLSIVSADMLAL